MRAFFKGLLLIGCLLFILGALLDRNDPPVAPLVALGAVSAVILAITLLVRRFARPFRHLPAGLFAAGGLGLVAWGGLTYRSNASGWGNLGAIILVLLGVVAVLGASLAALAAWLAGDRPPRE